MANIIRSAKSSSDWTDNEYNITITAQSPEQFFGRHTEPLLAGVEPSLIDSAVDDENVPDATFKYLGHLDLATRVTQESLINTFAAEALRILGFEERGLLINPRYSLPLVICDNRRVAETAMCLLDRRPAIDDLASFARE